MLWKLGHRRIAYLTPRNRLGGDIQGEQGLLDAIQHLSRGSAAGAVFCHNGSQGDIRRALAASLAETPPVTALIVARPLYALTALTYCLHRGVRIPDELSLVCRDDGEFFDSLMPALDRYTFNRRLFARRAVRMLIQLASAGGLQPQARWMMARYLKGETIAPPAASDLPIG